MIWTQVLDLRLEGGGGGGGIWTRVIWTQVLDLRLRGGGGGGGYMDSGDMDSGVRPEA